ncbi:hypothetical protein [Algisphaera agarilytica]|uniref:Uncharacterized protein n=1 Tax=Algisphaera agarilytica TaxID=1385975 RepID=A0A7X0H5Z4_9BACT|nr:hypothetical protein [Algisphaera agarilytica]MBB6429912.1 hypothetical protein [Algisphaera agarilytica]
MNIGPDKEDLAICFASHLGLSEPLKVKSLFFWLYQQYLELGYRPHHMSFKAQASDRVRKFRGINDCKNRMTADEWMRTDSVGLTYGEPHLRKSGGPISWTMQSTVSRHYVSEYDREEYFWMRSRWEADWCVFAAWSGINEADVIARQIGFAKQIVDDYGYLFWMRRGSAPSFYIGGTDFSTACRNEEQANNVGAWRNNKEHFNVPLLRDIYPYNFFTKKYLNLPVGDITLAGWIDSDRGRGVLTRLTDKVMMWEPVVENIPAIRETLFRAGVMFYWRFYAQDEYYRMDGPRSLRDDEATPDIFTKKFYEGLDPKLTL